MANLQTGNHPGVLLTSAVVPGSGVRRFRSGRGWIVPGLACGLAVVIGIAGCRRGEPIPDTPVPTADDRTAQRIERDPPRPLPRHAHDGPRYELPPDPPLMNFPPPEAPLFLEAYNEVGRPRIAVWVNRTLEGEVIHTSDELILEGRRRIIEIEGDIEATRRHRDYWGSSDERFRADGPARIEQREERYLAPGEYDELMARRVDYEALENALADAMAVRGAVTMVSPRVVRQRLSAEERQALAAGRVAVLDDMAERLGADILIHVQARPTAQTTTGLDLRIVAEAINTVGGESIGRSIADFSGPMSAARLEQVSRYMARRLMDDMTGVWLLPLEEAPQRQNAGQGGNEQGGDGQGQ